VSEAQEQVATQSRLVENLRARGEDTDQAEELLRILQEFLQLARQHLAAEERAARSRDDKG
jgi:hypothetical protein